MFLRIISFIIISINLLSSNVGYGLFPLFNFERSQKEAEIINDITGDTNMDRSVLYAKSVSNIPQAYFVNHYHDDYKMSNSNVSVTQNLASTKKLTVETPEGKTYLKDAINVFYESKGNTYYSSTSFRNGRPNTLRLGEYYYECHIRDLDFGPEGGELFRPDITYHLYADRLYEQISLIAFEPTNLLDGFGIEVKIPKSDLRSVRCKTADVYLDDRNGFSTDSAEYIAFDIRFVGIIGFIIPSDGSTGRVTFDSDLKEYTLRISADIIPGRGINAYDESGGYTQNSVTFGHRIYTDTTHNYNGIERTAYLERNPLTGIKVNSSNAGAVYLGYEHLRGTYGFTIEGIGFTEAFTDYPDLHFNADISVTCDDADRDIYIRMNGESGGLEAAALLDDKGTLVPINVQVSKNFQGDGGEPLYSVKDYAYGDSIYPLSLSAGQTIRHKLLNLYQNWGKHPLKQLSSIEFFTSYYHLSTGVTETNCIAPYFVESGKGWVLPDFRGFSSEFWQGQPQHNSVGCLYFAKYTHDDETVLSEYTGSEILSCGQCYSDIEYSYISDCGSYKYTLRHTEMPQTDENRTYYTMDITFLRDISFKNFKRDFSLFTFDGRMISYDKACYLDKDNNPVIKELNLSQGEFTEYIELGKENPYYGYLDISDDYVDQWVYNGFGANFALIIKDSEIKVGLKKLDCGFVFVNRWNGALNIGSLTLNKEKITFHKGDTIKLSFILLPCGQGTEETDENILRVREDSCIKPLTVDPTVGAVIDNGFVPTVKCVDNKADFTVSGGRNACALRICGFTDLHMPDVYMSVDGGGLEKLELASQNGYDGYTVYYNDNGTYDFSFVYDCASPDIQYHFIIK